MDVKKLKEHMTMAEVSVADLAEAAGVSPSTVYRWLSDGEDSALTVKAAERMADRLHLTPDEKAALFFPEAT